jgi:hypothetical protein
VEDIGIGLLGVCIARGGGLVMGAFRFEREDVDGKRGGGGGNCERSSSDSSAALMLMSSTSRKSSSMAEEGGGISRLDRRRLKSLPGRLPTGWRWKWCAGPV